MPTYISSSANSFFVQEPKKLQSWNFLGCTQQKKASYDINSIIFFIRSLSFDYLKIRSGAVVVVQMGDKEVLHTLRGDKQKQLRCMNG
ncbi:hypothetical protein HanRHA438_Chr05g0240661 [Helianthus annuus]|nr:hypothetical protein HanRHA438_Chr05g0240661 [Helianthus annuus]